MPKTGTRSPRGGHSQRDQILAVFTDYAEQDADKLFEFLQHCKIDLEPLSDKKVKLPDLITAHFYLAPGKYDIEALGRCLATFPPIAERIREIQAERAAQGCS